MIVFSNHLARLDATGRPTHLLRDWSGAMIPGNILYPPLEMMYAASYLRARGHEVSLVDGNARHLSLADTVAAIRALRPEIVVTVSGWFNLQHDLALCRLVKHALPACRTVLAGPNVTLDPHLTLASPEVDYVALGEFMDGVHEIAAGTLVRNVAYRENGGVTVKPFVPIEPLDRIPFAAWDLVDRRLYWVPFVRRHPFAAALTGVGCPHAMCAFCHQESYFGEAHRSHSAEYVIAETDLLIAQGFRDIIYRDQVFTARRDVVEALCRHLIARGRPVTWRASTRVDRVDRDLLQLMAAAGCYQMSFGFESFSDRALEWCNKGATVEDGERAARWAKEAGLEVSGGFIVGVPGEEIRRDSDALRLIRRRGIDFPQFFALTLVYDRAQRRFRSLRDNAAADAQVRRRMRRLALRFYLSPRYVVSQIRRIAATQGLRRVPGFFVDFLRYFW
jgi:radical SAM superfamily enzyme YgiQ (UPF0313 family)